MEVTSNQTEIVFTIKLSKKEADALAEALYDLNWSTYPLAENVRNALIDAGAES